MLNGMSSLLKDLQPTGEAMTHQPEESDRLIKVCIPKVEPYYSTRDEDSTDEISNYGEMISPIPFTAPYKVRDPIVLLERCDKIWETLQLIKDVQSEDDDKIVHNEEQTMQTPEVPDNSNISDVAAIKSTSSYIEYQPTLKNISTVLPNLQISVKFKKKVHHCVICGKQYIGNRSLRAHSDKVHGIYIPPKWHRTSRKKSEEPDESKLIDKETDNSAKVEETKESHELGDENETPKLNFRLQKRRKLPINDSNNIDVNHIVMKEHKSNSLNNKLQQSHKTSLAPRDSILCILCKHFVANIKEHLTDYHKIEYTDMMMKELKKATVSEVPTTSKDKDSKKRTSTTNESTQKGSVAAVPKETLASKLRNATLQNSVQRAKRKETTPQVNPPKRHKSNDDSFDSSSVEHPQSPYFKGAPSQCDICFGMYASTRNLQRHKRIHLYRGETKENFNLVECRYLNSPFFLKSRAMSNTSNTSSKSENMNSSKETNSNFSGKRRTRQQTANTMSDGEQRSERKHYDSTETTCSCGRSFRNPHTLFTHKNKCKLQMDGEQQFTRNSSDRDSGIGISLTIKKKNDSYEIVGRDSGDENNSKDSGHSKDSDASSEISECMSKDFDNVWSKARETEILESSKYSKDHSILKLISVDEDIDVDVEADPLNSTCKDPINGTVSTKELRNPQHKEDVTEEKIKVGTGVRRRNVPSLKYLCRKVLIKNKLIKPKSRVLTRTWRARIREYLYGKKYHTQLALNYHMQKHQQNLRMCAYCKESFSNLDEEDKHECAVEKGRPFADPLEKIDCYYCNSVLIGKRKFDDHVKMKHYNPEKPFQCYNCPKRFSTHPTRYAHYIRAHGTTFCSFCKKKCHVSVKVRHESYHLGLGFPCHLCKKAYPAKRILTKHIKLVHESKDSETIKKTGDSDTCKPKCNVCGLSFTSKKCVLQHLRKNCL